MKKIIRLGFVILMAVMAFSSCSNEDKEIGSREQLIGRWKNAKEYIVFYDDNAGDGYAWGKEWDEADGTKESDVDADNHGNGWFKWKKGNDYIRIVAMMSISEAGAAVDRDLSALSDTEMTLVNKRGTKKTYTKQ